MPEDPSGTGPIDHLVQVHCDPATHTVTIACPRVTVRPGDRVIWSFSGIQEGWSPWIQIRRDGEGASFLGPFRSLSQSAGGVWGPCRLDQAAGTFSYRAAIQKGVGMGWDTESSVLFSRSADIEVAPPATGHRRSFEVRVAGDGADHKLLVTPDLVTLEPADTLEWTFHGIPGEPGSWRPRVDFVRYTGEAGPVPNLLLGPFNSLTYEADSVRGTGNNSLDGTYFFEVTLVSAVSGEVLWFSSGDPAVDNRGTVGDPGSGFITRPITR
jgi:plastocyanin